MRRPKPAWAMAKFSHAASVKEPRYESSAPMTKVKLSSSTPPFRNPLGWAADEGLEGKRYRGFHHGSALAGTL